jgi:hypothetical protein
MGTAAMSPIVPPALRTSSWATSSPGELFTDRWVARGEQQQSKLYAGRLRRERGGSMIFSAWSTMTPVVSNGRVPR